MSKNKKNLYLDKRVLEKMLEKEDYFRRDQMEKVKKDIERKEQQRSNLQDNFLDGEITPKIFNEITERIDKEMALLKNNLNGLQQEMSPYKNYVKHTLPMLENLLEYYRKADGKTKNKILSCIFDGKLVLDKGKVASTPFTIPIQVLINANKVLGRSEKKKEAENDLLFALAPPVRLELTTL